MENPIGIETRCKHAPHQSLDRRRNSMENPIGIETGRQEFVEVLKRRVATQWKTR